MYIRLYIKFYSQYNLHVRIPYIYTWTRILLTANPAHKIYLCSLRMAPSELKNSVNKVIVTYISVFVGSLPIIGDEF